MVRWVGQQCATGKADKIPAVGGGVVVKLSFQKDSSVSIANYSDRYVNLEAVLVAKRCS